MYYRQLTDDVFEEAYRLTFAPQEDPIANEDTDEADEYENECSSPEYFPETSGNPLNQEIKSSIHQGQVSPSSIKTQPRKCSKNQSITSAASLKSSKRIKLEPKTVQPPVETWPISYEKTYVADPKHPCWYRGKEEISLYIPSTVSLRTYQREILRTALLYNTLVCLPTGCGKTLIAAVLMANHLRLFSSSLILFMAPTRPLVLQQIEACVHAIPGLAASAVSMTGQQNSATRKQLWATHRIFFVTPHIPANDIARGDVPIEHVSLIVIDEAHRSTGNYAVVPVVQALLQSNPCVRILALTATPGSRTATIQGLITRLAIARIECRDESSPEIRSAAPGCRIDRMVIKPTPEMIKFRKMIADILMRPINWLIQAGAIPRIPKPTAVTSNGSIGTFLPIGTIETLREQYRRKIATTGGGSTDQYFRSNVEAHFGAAMTLSHGMSRLEAYGLHFFREWVNEQTSRPSVERTSIYFSELIKSVEWCRLYVAVNELPSDDDDCLTKHPKDDALCKILGEHFSQDPEGASRVIIFAHLREVVARIVENIENFPGVRAKALVGVATKKKTGDQKVKHSVSVQRQKQISVLDEFREGIINVLVATSVAEEGLDVGSVDLIICYDVQASPIRAIQRIGRAGRRRPGRGVMLATEGSEELQMAWLIARKNALYTSLKKTGRFDLNSGLPDSVLAHRHTLRITDRVLDDLDTTPDTKNDTEISQGPLNSTELTNKSSSSPVTLDNHSNGVKDKNEIDSTPNEDVISAFFDISDIGIV